MNNEENEGLAFRNLESRELDGVAQQERPRRKRIGQSSRSYAYKNDVDIKEKDCDDNPRYPYPKKYGRERYNHSFGSSRDRWAERFSRDNSERETSSSRVFSSGRETRFYDKHGRPAQGEHFQRNSNYKRGYDRRFSYGKQGYKRQHSDNNYASRTQDYDPSAKYNHQKVLRYKEENIDLSVPIRLNRYLSNAGICSRREADRYIQNGLIKIDGITAQIGDRVMPGQDVTYNGRSLSKEDEMILIALNKPEGIVCTAEKREKNNVIDYINYPKRIYPIGRLDKDSKGLLLLTNNGDIVNKMMRSGNRHEKEYIVTVNRNISDSFIRGLAGGVPLVELGVTTRKCHVKKLSSRQFKIILTQGYNRQIRRMCEYFGYRVVELERVRIMNISLGNLEPGKYRKVTEQEYKTLQKLIEGSSNGPVKDQGRNNR